MEENKTLFDAAIVNEEGVIENVLVFDNEDTMHEFGALRLAEGQGIGDIYITPEEMAKKRQKEELHAILSEGVDQA